MHPSIAAALVAALLTAGWLLGRRRVPLVRDPDTSGVAALNRAQIALVHSGAASQPDRPSRQATASFRRLEPAPAAAFPSPSRALGRAAFKAQLEALFRGDGADRLRAVQAAQQWGDRLSLPLLRRGLRDSDPAVMRASALAIERFRGRPAAPRPAAGSQRAALPRNVARTR